MQRLRGIIIGGQIGRVFFNSDFVESGTQFCPHSRARLMEPKMADLKFCFPESWFDVNADDGRWL